MLSCTQTHKMFVGFETAPFCFISISSVLQDRTHTEYSTKLIFVLMTNSHYFSVCLNFLQRD